MQLSDNCNIQQTIFTPRIQWFDIAKVKGFVQLSAGSALFGKCEQNVRSLDLLM
jgi:hypothetical protein